jgi:hypothetical protein
MRREESKVKESIDKLSEIWTISNFETLERAETSNDGDVRKRARQMKRKMVQDLRNLVEGLIKNIKSWAVVAKEDDPSVTGGDKNWSLPNTVEMSLLMNLQGFDWSLPVLAAKDDIQNARFASLVNELRSKGHIQSILSLIGSSNSNLDRLLRPTPQDKSESLRHKSPLVLETLTLLEDLLTP